MLGPLLSAHQRQPSMARPRGPGVPAVGGGAKGGGAAGGPGGGGEHAAWGPGRAGSTTMQSPFYEGAPQYVDMGDIGAHRRVLSVDGVESILPMAPTTSGMYVWFFVGVGWGGAGGWG